MNAAGARVIADSITEEGHRLTTFEATCWRPLLAEQNTHCVLARNSASSRARSVEKVLEEFERDFAWPVVWGSEKKGMQAGPPLEGHDLDYAKELWNDIRWFISYRIRRYLDEHPLDIEGAKRLHKSLLNRLLEFGLWQTQIITATQWDGYFWQRCHKDAEPHIRLMAEAMRDAREASTPKLLKPGEWHLPYWAENGGHESDWQDAVEMVKPMFAFGDEGSFDWQKAPQASFVEATFDIAKKCSTARCARVSYLTQSGVRDLIEDLNLYARLTSNRVGSEDPPHASPLEHIATPWAENVQHVTMPNGVTMGPLPRLGKLIGWLQLRHLELGF